MTNNHPPEHPLSSMPPSSPPYLPPRPAVADPPPRPRGYHPRERDGSDGRGPRPASGFEDHRLRLGVAEVLAMVADRLQDGASQEVVLPLIGDAVRAWAERQVRAG